MVAAAPHGDCGDRAPLPVLGWRDVAAAGRSAALTEAFDEPPGARFWLEWVLCENVYALVL